MLLDVTVVFPYYNENDTILTTLDLISRQTILPNEIIFVNSTSLDKTSNTINDWIKNSQGLFETSFRNIFEGTNNPASSKNVGIINATSTWVAFMDCGLLFDLDWLEKQWNYVKEHNVDVVSGNVILVGIGSIDQAAVAQTYGYKRLRPCVPSTLVKKSVFNKTGPFLENRRAGYDVAWPLLLKKLGIERGINEKVVIKYNGVNYGNSLWFILKKSILYAKPTVGIKHYYIPYYYLLILFITCLSVLGFPPLIAPIFLTYFICRGYWIPINKSNGILMFSTNPFLIFWLPILAITLDLGRTVGTILGFIKYHITKN